MPGRRSSEPAPDIACSRARWHNPPIWPSAALVRHEPLGPRRLRTMDPLTLILAALGAGAAAAAKETASGAVKDAYQGLKTLIQRRFAGKPEAEIALVKHE